ncbi:MAG: hypothetical protein OXS35_06220 [Dehalococcoidia bacterium]|nr:hypothetical protein [Dehalococcoidia bacterium]
MSHNLAAFEEETRHVVYAHKQAERHYDKHPPNSDAVPIAEAINAWTLISGCYMGIEQTMKLLIMMRMGVKRVPPNFRKGNGHDLGKLYSLLDDSERLVVDNYYKVYRSIHNFDSDTVSLDTAEQFIQHIGNGYVAWRYILIEDSSAVPKIHIGLLLELWRALADIAMHHVHGKNYETLAHILDEYIQQSVIVVAEQDDDWQAASQDENSNTNFGEIRQWFLQNGGVLKAGIHLFEHRARGSSHSSETSPLLQKVLFRAADRAMREAEIDRANRSAWQNIDAYPPGQVVYFQNSANYKARRTDIDMFHDRIKGSGLTWNADKGVFE